MNRADAARPTPVTPESDEGYFDFGDDWEPPAEWSKAVTDYLVSSPDQGDWEWRDHCEGLAGGILQALRPFIDAISAELQAARAVVETARELVEHGIEYVDDHENRPHENVDWSKVEDVETKLAALAERTPRG